MSQNTVPNVVIYYSVSVIQTITNVLDARYSKFVVYVLWFKVVFRLNFVEFEFDFPLPYIHYGNLKQKAIKIKLF